jgi:hypothetical protein
VKFLLALLGPFGQAAGVSAGAAVVVGAVATLQASLSAPVDPSNAPNTSFAGTVAGQPVAVSAFLPETAVARFGDSICWVSLGGVRRLTLDEAFAPGATSDVRRVIGLDRAGGSDADVNFIYPASGLHDGVATVLVSRVDVGEEAGRSFGPTGCVRGLAPAATAVKRAPAR